MADHKKLPAVELPADVRRRHAGRARGPARQPCGENSEALFLTSSFVHPDAATAARRFANEEEAFVYCRFSNPTVTMIERRLAALEGTAGLHRHLQRHGGDHDAGAGPVEGRRPRGVFASVFGSTIKLFQDFARFGVQTSFVSQTDVSAWKAALQPNTKLLFAESPTNPLTEVCDIRALADIAHGADALLVVDNCFCSPALQRPVELGADLVMHSGTKYLDGQGRVIAGALCGPAELIDAKLVPTMRSAGMSLSPFNAWVVLKGMETLSIRMQAQSERALQLARWLETQPQVERVYYPGLPSHPQHELAMAQQGGVGGAVVSFVLKAGDADRARANAFAVIDATRICSITANLGDTKTTITHPSSTSHGRLSEAQRQSAGITQGMIRLAMGLDDVRDIMADLKRGFDQL